MKAKGIMMVVFGILSTIMIYTPLARTFAHLSAGFIIGFGLAYISNNKKKE